MSRSQSRYVCQGCGEAFLRWEGQCRNCGAWNSLVETLVREPSHPRAAAAGSALRRPQRAASLRDADDAIDRPRAASGLSEFDRVLGGGLVSGSLVLLGGEPGIGKSTLLLQVAAGLAEAAARANGGWVLYASGEESAGQVRLRAARLGLLGRSAADVVRVVAEHEIGAIVEIARSERPTLVVVDSIQTATLDELEGPAGSVGQVRESALRLMELAKGDGIAVVLVGHLTKDGSLAGPKTLEHLVDAVLTLEGERYATLRLLRASKNRFGSTEEVGVFEMGEVGLRELADPARAFVGDGALDAPGSVVAPTLEGSRPILVEVQALVAPGAGGNPRRTASGLDASRVALLIAVLGRRAGIGLGSHDVYANVAGGLTVEEPALDLPIAIALASSLRDRSVTPLTVAVGEVGLLGELRSVPGLERRLREAARLGYVRAIVPRPSRGATLPAIPGLEIVAVDSLAQAIGAALRGGSRVQNPGSDDARAPSRIDADAGSHPAPAAEPGAAPPHEPPIEAFGEHGIAARPVATVPQT
ncbi:MAG TPA: DNA repair protein RadA [Candidatus Saccharimonadales bacterium]|nr:DNA repair protein RadA [Candidatus Saccharimonadales bacterium]